MTSQVKLEAQVRILNLLKKQTWFKLRFGRLALSSCFYVCELCGPAAYFAELLRSSRVRMFVLLYVLKLHA